MKGSMCFQLGSLISLLPASTSLGFQQPHFICTFSIHFSLSWRHFCWNKLYKSSVNFLGVYSTEEIYTHRSFWDSPSLPGVPAEMAEGQHPPACLWLKGSATLALDLLKGLLVWLNTTLIFWCFWGFNKRLYSHILRFLLYVHLFWQCSEAASSF